MELIMKRREVLESIQQIFANQVNDYILDYSGHGQQGSRNWFFNNETVSFKEGIDLWNWSNASNPNKRLLIIVDSCYSGWWQQKEQVWCNSAELECLFQSPTTPTFDNVFIQSATLVHEKSHGVQWLLITLLFYKYVPSNSPWYRVISSSDNLAILQKVPHFSIICCLGRFLEPSLLDLLTANHANYNLYLSRAKNARIAKNFGKCQTHSSNLLN